jgi:hypothetical protein
LLSGSSPNGELNAYTGSAAMASITSMPLPTTWPNAVNPPFCASRFALLLARLKNHWFVALFGLPPSFAIDIVPRTLEYSGSLTTDGLVGIPSIFGPWS